MSNEHPTLEDVFAQLDAWRHLPAYRLEPRVDPFFAIFLRHVLERHLGVPLEPDVLPELPLRRGMLYGPDAPGPNKSKKVDFVLRSADRRTIYLVELKTDQGSRRDEQDDYLLRALDAGWRRVVEGIVAVVRQTASGYRQKYLHLIHRLEAMGYLEVPPALYDHAFPEVRSGLAAELAKVAVLMPEGEPALRVLYVQPQADGEADSVGFGEFADTIQGSGELGALFAARLRSWTAPAGSAPVKASTPKPERQR